MTTEDLWFRIIIIFVLILFIALFIINAIWWNKVKNSNCVNLSTSQANTMMWLNIIWAVIAGIILIWAIVRIFIKPKPDYQKLAQGMAPAPPLVINPAVGQPVIPVGPPVSLQPSDTQMIMQGQPQVVVPGQPQVVVSSEGYPGNTFTGGYPQFG